MAGDDRFAGDLSRVGRPGGPGGATGRSWTVCRPEGGGRHARCRAWFDRGEPTASRRGVAPRAARGRGTRRGRLMDGPLAGHQRRPPGAGNSLDPAEWTVSPRARPSDARRSVSMTSSPSRKDRSGGPCRTRCGPPGRRRCRGRHGRRRRLRRLPASRGAVWCWQPAPPIFRVGAWRRHGDRHAGRDAGGGPERELWRPRPCADRGRAPGGPLGRRDVGLPARRRVGCC